MSLPAVICEEALQGTSFASPINPGVFRSEPNMAIRFSCNCGATFEVPDEQAGQRGRCLGCGEELTIPCPAKPCEDVGGEVENVAPLSEEPDHSTETVHGMYCPFCGAFAGKDAVKCPSCARFLEIPVQDPNERPPLTTGDWILVTALAPPGIVAGFVQLVMGSKKGLDLIGIAVAAILIWWFIFLVMGWIG